MTEESMQIGASVVSWTSLSIFDSSSASSTSGMPALTSSTSAPASICALVSTVTVVRSPPRSSSANRLRPVGLIRSPMMQNGCSRPITTVFDRPCRTVSMLLLVLRGDGCPALLEQLLGLLDGGRRVGGVAVGADGVGVLLGDRRAADHDGDLLADAGLLQCVDVRLEHRHRRREERREADDVGLVPMDLLDELLRRHVDAEVDHGEAGAFEHDVAEVLADVVHVALDGAHQERAGRLRAGLGQQRPQDVERPLHRARGDQHLGNEVVAALEARADLLERRDQRVVEHPLGFEVVCEALLDALLDGRRVADERLLVQEREDLVVRHAAPTPSVRWPSSSASALACLITIGRSSAVRLLDSRSVGPDTLSAATARPASSSTGAATALSPSSSSSTTVAKPSRRTVSSSAASSAGSVIVREVSGSSGPCTAPAAPNASSTLPLAEQW